MAPRISLLYQFFVTSQRLKHVLADGLADSGMRPDQYAVYSLLFDEGPVTASEMADALGMPLTTVLDYLKVMNAAGHIVRTTHPFDGRAVELSLSRSGVSAHTRAHSHWEVVRKLIEDGLSEPITRVANSLTSLEAAAIRAEEGLMMRRRRGRHRSIRRAGLGRTV